MSYKFYLKYLSVIFVINIFICIVACGDACVNNSGLDWVNILLSFFVFSVHIIPFKIYGKYMNKNSKSDEISNFPVPNWFKRAFRDVLDNMAEIRFFQIFVFYPVLFITPIFGIGLFALFYNVPIIILSLLYFAIKWIIKGADKPLK